MKLFCILGDLHEVMLESCHGVLLLHFIVMSHELVFIFISCHISGKVFCDLAWLALYLSFVTGGRE